MRIDSTHAVSAMKFKNEGKLCPELKIIDMQAKSLLMKSIYLHETRNRWEEERLFDMSVKYHFILIGLNVRVTRAEYMGENYEGVY